MSIWKQLTGSIGSLITGLCCLGFAPALGLLTALGVGFLINDLILIPLLAVFLGISIWDLKAASRSHGDKRLLWLGIIFALVAFITLWFAPAVAYLGLIGLFSVSIWNIYKVRTCKV